MKRRRWGVVDDKGEQQTNRDRQTLRRCNQWVHGEEDEEEYIESNTVIQFNEYRRFALQVLSGLELKGETVNKQKERE